MGTLIKGRQVVPEPPRSPDDGPRSPDEKVIRLEPGDDPAAIDFGAASRIEVNFPKFGDGRGYSIARLLRERYGYKGELRAVGQITRDHLYSMERVGFDAYELREGEDPAEALSAFQVFSAAYQKR